MLVPILIAGGAALGLWYLLKGSDGNAQYSTGGPSQVQPPNQPDLVSLVESPGYTVVVLACNTNTESYQGFEQFSSWDNAWEYYKKTVDYFEGAHSAWTCPTGSGFVALAIVETQSKTRKASRVFASCPGTIPMGLRDHTDELRKFLKSLGISTGAAPRTILPTVRMIMATTEDTNFSGTWTFVNSMAADRYYYYLVNAFIMKSTVEFYRQGGTLAVSVTVPTGEFDRGEISWWDGTEVANSSGEISPKVSQWIGKSG